MSENLAAVRAEMDGDQTFEPLGVITQTGAVLQVYSKQDGAPAMVDLESDEQAITYRGQTHTAFQDQQGWFANALSDRPLLAKTTRALVNKLQDRCRP